MVGLKHLALRQSCDPDIVLFQGGADYSQIWQYGGHDSARTIGTYRSILDASDVAVCAEAMESRWPTFGT